MPSTILGNVFDPEVSFIAQEADAVVDGKVSCRDPVGMTSPPPAVRFAGEECGWRVDWLTSSRV